MHFFTPADSLPVQAKRLVGIVSLALLSSGCGIWSEQGEDEERQQASGLYRQANNALQQRNYTDALEKYKQLELSFPFNPYAQSASIEKAYAHYKNHHYEETIGTLDQFIRMHPDHANIDYVYYLKGLAHYNYAQSPINWFLKRDRTNKDPTPLKEGFSAFTELLENYPDSIYSSDARARAVALRNMLAVHEIRIANYYMRRQAYLAVINRCNYVLENYPGAQHTPETLWMLAEAYQRVGSPELARDTYRVIELNYPEFVQQGRRSPEKNQSGWKKNLKDLSDTIYETLRFKPRY